MPLTSFRFFAALAIVFFHALPSGGHHEFLASGVSFFFVLSGFVLTYVHPRIDGMMEFARFWVARVARIWPLHLFTLAVVLLFRPFGLLPYKHFSSEFFLNAFLLQCWVPVHRITLSFNFVSWSISVELFFYLAFPFLLPLVFKAPGKMSLGAAALHVLLATGAALLGLPDSASIDRPSFDDFLYCPVLHLYEFVLGMAVAVWWAKASPAARPTARWSCLEIFSVGAILLVIPFLKQISLVLVHGQTGYRVDGQVEALLCAPLFALLIYVFAFQAGMLSKVFSQAWLVYLGDISFSTYMIHCILIAEFNRMPASVLPVVKWTLFGLAVFFASGMLYAFVEKPSRRWLVGRGDSFLGKARPPQPDHLAAT